jgi:hypothetical protein
MLSWANNNLAFWKTKTASGVVGMLAPSAIQIQPLATVLLFVFVQLF